MAGPSGPVFVRFQDLKFFVFSIMDFDSQGLDVEIFGFTPPKKLSHGNGKSHSSKWLSFPVVIWRFSGFFDLIC